MKQNICHFKASNSIFYAISRHQIQFFSGIGYNSLPRPSVEGQPPPHTPPTRRLRRLDPRALPPGWEILDPPLPTSNVWLALALAKSGDGESDMDMGQLFETQPNPQHVIHQPNPTHFHISLVETILFVILQFSRKHTHNFTSEYKCRMLNKTATLSNQSQKKTC